MEFFQILENLEDRIAPATLVDASSVSYQDIDGDAVTIKFSQKVLNPTNFGAGLAFASDGHGHDFLQGIDLAAMNLDPAKIKDLGITITAKKGKTGGNNLVDVGAILGAGFDLGNVQVGGALAAITVGDGNAATAGLKSLKIDSLGLADGSEPGDFSLITSAVTGSIGKLDILHNINKAYLFTSGSLTDAKIGGSLIGGNADNSGAIHAEGKIGKISVGGSLVGGAGEYSGSITATGNIESIAIAGNITGGNGADGYSGVVEAHGKILSINVTGNLVGGEGERSGTIRSDAGIDKVALKGSIIGGDGYGAGRIETAQKIAQVSIGGKILAGTADYAGSVMSTKAMDSVTVNGNLEGGSHIGTGTVFSEEGIGKVSIGGKLMGGAGAASGAVQAQGVIKTADVKGDMLGSAGNGSGSVLSYGGAFQKTSHKGAMTAGSGDNSGVFYQPSPSSSGGGASYGVSGVTMNYGLSSTAIVTSGVLAFQSADLGNAVLSGLIGGTGGLTKISLGTLTLAGQNTYTGMTTISAGALVVAPTGTLNWAPGSTIADGATLVVNPGAIVKLPDGSLLPAGTYTKESLASFLAA